MRPAEYRYGCTVRHDLPYSVMDHHTKGPQPTEGMLHVGRVVWLDHDLKSYPGKVTIPAYAEGIGLVQIDTEALAAAC